MNKPVVVHMINTLGLGGAEVLLAHSLPLLTDFDNILVCLTPPHNHAPELPPIPVHCVEHRGVKDLARTAARLRAILRRYKPDILHTHLLESTWLGRLVCPVSTAFAFSVHSIMSQDAFIPNPKSLMLEKLSLRRRHNLIAVSETVREDYIKYTGFKGRSFVLHNFIPDAFFRQLNLSRRRPPGHLRCISVGNLKAVKNHPYVLEAMRRLRDLPISLDIYGQGYMREELQRTIDEEQLNVRLMGVREDIENCLPDYDVCIAASLHEGYGLAVLEAMASGVPVILSDIPVFREVSGGHALFTDLSNPETLSVVLRHLLAGEVAVDDMIHNGYAHAKQIAGKAGYAEGLKYIYETISGRQA